MTTIEELEQRLDRVESENEQLRAENAQLQERVNTVESENEQLKQRVSDLEEQPKVEIVDETDPIGSIEIGGAPVGNTLTAKAEESDVDYNLDEIEALRNEFTAEQTVQGGEMGCAGADLTPVEQLAQADDPAEVTSSQSAARAITLFKHISDWGKKTPKGRCLRPKDNPLELLEAASNESLAWKQYYRAAKALEDLSNGAVTFFDSDRHGKMLVLHEQSEVYSRVENGTLSASSAREKV